MKHTVESVYPGEAWEKATPESQGMDSRVIETCLNEFNKLCGSDGTSQVTIVRNGYLIWEGAHCNALHNVWSCTKSISSIVLGLLVDDGRVSVDTKLCEMLPELKNLYPDLTFRHVFSLVDGYQGLSEMYPFAPREPRFRPKEFFHYDCDGLNQASRALTCLAGESMASLFSRRLAEPLQMSRWFWGGYGILDGFEINGFSGTHYKGFHTTALDISRIGLLLLNEGRWKGKTLLSPEYIKEASSIQAGLTSPIYDPNDWYKELYGSYGLGFWVNGIQANGTRLFPALSSEIMLIQGNVNNFCFIIPEWNMVLTRLGTDLIIPADSYNRIFEVFKELIG